MDGGKCKSICKDREFYDRDKLVCKKCNETCYECKGPHSSDCVNCRSDLTYYQGTCILDACGDGKRISSYEECDDGNSENGDGCNSKCIVERNNKCRGGGP